VARVRAAAEAGTHAAPRAFQAVAQHAFGKRGQPRFKRVGELRSVEGKMNAAG
jgi:hypothetical protein